LSWLLNTSPTSSCSTCECRAIKALNGLKALDGLKDTPVVFLSAKGQQNEMESGMEAGAYDYILKPFAPDHLNERINEILAKSKKPPVSKVEPGCPRDTA